MGLELELVSCSVQLPPIRTTAAARTDYDDGEACSTPTAAANVLRPPSVCPPAPRKPRPPVSSRLKKKHARCRRRRCCCSYCGRRRSGAPAARGTSFVAVPDDLVKVFVSRLPATASSTAPDGKKIRVHVVG